MFGSCFAALLRRFVFDHACCLSFDKQDGLRNVAFLFRRVEIAIRVFSGCWRGYLPLWERGTGLRGDAVLLRRFVLGSRPVYGSIVAFCVRSRLLFVF